MSVIRVSESEDTQDLFFLFDAIGWRVKNTRMRMLYFADELGNGWGVRTVHYRKRRKDMYRLLFFCCFWSRVVVGWGELINTRECNKDHSVVKPIFLCLQGLVDFQINLQWWGLA